jgi:hypothetical protein
MKAVLSFIEYPIKQAELRVERLEPKLRISQVPGLLIIGLSVSIPAGLLLFIEYLLSHYFPLPPWLAFIHHPVAWTVPLFTIVLVTMIKIRSEYRRERGQLKGDLDEIKKLYGKLQEPTFVINLLGEFLVFSQDREPLKLILDGLQPTNLEIVKKIDNLSEVTLTRFEFLNYFLRLPPDIQNSLSSFLRSDLLAQPWGPLYMTFAIQLQLDPWTQVGQRSPRYVFVRDIEEIGCFYDNTEDATTAFRDRLEKDLETILNLVHNTLWSVMYKDINVWRQPAYYQSNVRLLNRTKDTGINLRRMFFFEDEWLENDNILRPLVYAALWHAKCNYPCRYVKIKVNKKRHVIESANGTNYLVDKANHLVDGGQNTCIASCLLNETNIMLYQVPPPFKPSTLGVRDPKRYIYRCDAETAIVNDYRASFEQVWDSVGEAGTAESFLNMIEAKRPGLRHELKTELESNGSL